MSEPSEAAEKVFQWVKRLIAVVLIGFVIAFALGVTIFRITDEDRYRECADRDEGYSRADYYIGGELPPSRFENRTPIGELRRNWDESCRHLYLDED